MLKSMQVLPAKDISKAAFISNNFLEPGLQKTKCKVSVGTKASPSTPPKKFAKRQSARRNTNQGDEATMEL